MERAAPPEAGSDPGLAAVPAPARERAGRYLSRYPDSVSSISLASAMSTSDRNNRSDALVGMRGFSVVVLGQAVSLIGTGMTRFALMYWAFERTGEATALALIGFFSFAPLVIVSPLAGALVDRWNRKLVMMLSDLAAGLATAALLTLFVLGRLEFWHIYVAGAFAGAFEAFQWPAFSAAITTMVPKEQYGRANGMFSLAQALSGILAPVLAGGLLEIVGIEGIMSLDVVTFGFAIFTLILVSVPEPAVSSEGRAGAGSLVQESIYGFRYIVSRRPLLALQLVFTGINLTGTLGFTLIAPMILARTGSDASTLATVMAVAGSGGVAGGLLMSTWGGPKRRINGVLGGMIVGGLIGQVMMGWGNSWLIWSVAACINSIAVTVLNASNQSIWQAKVEPDVQGRVFSVRRLIAQVSAPIGMLLAGPLADKLFEPAMMPGGRLEPALGGIFGTGPGSGMAVIFVLSGLLSALIGLAGFAVPAIRDVEEIIPDHDAVPPEDAASDMSRRRPLEAAPTRHGAAARDEPCAQEAAASDRDRLLPRGLVVTAILSAAVGACLMLAVLTYLNDRSLHVLPREETTSVNLSATADAAPRVAGTSPAASPEPRSEPLRPAATATLRILP